MTAPAHRVDYSYAEYLALEATSNVKHEYLGGQIYGMAGGSPEHAALAAAVVGMLFPQLGGRCRVFTADLRVRVEASGLSTYPDVTVVCGATRAADVDPLAVVNPVVLFEVSSPSTEAYDRTDKFEHYRQIASLQHYVIVSHRERAITVRTRGEDGSWSEQTAGEHDVVELPAIAAQLVVRSLYDVAAEPR